MGQVYGAVDPNDGTEVALKVVREGLIGSEGVRRLEREAGALAAVQHPHLVRFREFGQEAGRVFLVMERVQGSNMLRWLAARPAPAAVHEAFCDAGEGLRAAHEAGFVHRDFKPSNVLWAVPGGAKVADFGLTKYVGDDPAHGFETLTLSGVWMGTPAYMAPEQFGEEAVDQRCDQFAFCVALWEGLCRRHPFAGDSGKPPRSLPQMAMRLAQGMRASWPAQLPAGLGAALRRGMSRQPDERFDSMAALLAELREHGP